MQYTFPLGLCLAVFSSMAQAADFRIESSDLSGNLTWSGAYTAGVCTVETVSTLGDPWTPRENYYTSNAIGGAQVSLSPSNTFCRLLAVDISTNTPFHYTNLLQSYGILETVAGRGDTNIDSSQWRPSFEGAWATNVNLSRPHSSFGDSRGNVLIVDQRSSAVLKVTPEGRLYTYAGTHIAGDNGDIGYATNLQLRYPNGGWLGTNDVFYVLDTENGKARKIYTNGWMETLFSTDPMGDGRAFWVASDESVIYFGSGPDTATTLSKWTRADNTIRVIRSDFKNMGNILCDERTGDLYISDREAYRVYRMEANTTNLTTIAGNGTSSGYGGEGAYATNTSLNLPRSVWFIPNGGFFIGEHDPGNRIWYVDPEGKIHRWMNGSGADKKRVGDGRWFYESNNVAKVSRVRSVVTDPFGNLIITESNYGYVRRIRFHRMLP
jgi:hypothetical protein